MLKVFLIQTDSLLVQVLTNISDFCLLQVGQEISVDWATLNERHAADRSNSQQSPLSPEPGVHVKPLYIKGESCCNLKTDWMLKCCRRMAKLSHAPSIANLLAQYTSLKGSPEGDHRGGIVLAISSMKASKNLSQFHPNHEKKTACRSCWHTVNSQMLVYLTVKPSSAARYQNVTLAPSLHVWQESLDCLDGTEEIDLEDLPHRVQRLHL